MPDPDEELDVEDPLAETAIVSIVRDEDGDIRIDSDLDDDATIATMVRSIIQMCFVDYEDEDEDEDDEI